MLRVASGEGTRFSNKVPRNRKRVLVLATRHPSEEERYLSAVLNAYPSSVLLLD